MTITFSLALIVTIGVSFYSPWRKPLFENSDFEMGNLTHWTPHDLAFVDQPIFHDNPIYRGSTPARPQGQYWIGSFEDRNSPGKPSGHSQGDLPMGELVSDEFEITGDVITFLIGGGDGSGQTGVALLVDGEEVLFEPGRGALIQSEKMLRVAWNVSRWKGYKAKIIIRDQSQGSWGHINADDFLYD